MSVPTDLARHWTIDDLKNLPDEGDRYEIVDWNLVVSPPGARFSQSYGTTSDPQVAPDLRSFYPNRVVDTALLSS